MPALVMPPREETTAALPLNKLGSTAILAEVEDAPFPPARDAFAPALAEASDGDGVVVLLPSEASNIPPVPFSSQRGLTLGNFSRMAST